MTLKKFLIAGGNSTLLVWGCLPSEKNQIVKKYLGEVEQIGFIKVKDSISKLVMMGNELCINGTIALASTLGKKGFLQTSGYEGLVRYQNTGKQTKIALAIPFQRINNVVLLSGIGFIYLKTEQDFAKLLPSLCAKYKLPAFGAILYENKQLVPYVYVLETNSLFKETACGSGSIAFSILTGKEYIVQPTGKIISVMKNDNTFIVTAKVRRWS